MVGNRQRTRAEHLGPDSRRPQVLDAALAIAERLGVRAVTMAGVAEALAVTKPVIYACYPGRDELIDALLAREEERLFTGVMAALPVQLDLDDPETMFREGFTALLSVVTRYPSSWQLVLAPDPDASVATRYGRSRARVSARVAELMRVAFEGVGKPDLERKLPILVDLFMSAGDAAVRAMLRDRDAWTPEALGAFIARVTLAALRSA